MKSAYSFLSSAYTLQNFTSIDNALSSDDFFKSRIVLLDINDPVQYGRVIDAINEKNPQARIIMAWGAESMMLPAEIPRIFYFIRKPFSNDRLSEVIEKALFCRMSHERRREPRIEVDLPVELVYRTRLWETKTRNISLHGMQVVWPEQDLIEDIVREHGRGSTPVSACRLYLSKKDILGEDHINIPVSLRYTEDTGQGKGPVLMGFEFNEMDLELRMRLYKAVTEFMEAR